jgi:tRNA A37 threonylcarbamoyladenosine modification protein TsaB
VLLDGKRGMLYASFYDKSDKALRETKKPSLMSIDAVLKTVKAQTYFTGGGVSLFKEKLLESGKAFFSDAGAVHPKAERIGELAWERIQKKKFTDPFKLEPLYLHPKDCNAVLPKKP